MFNLNGNDMFFIPVITGIVSMLKSLGLKKTFASLVSLVLGIILSLIFSTEPELKFRALKGMILGLSASGFYTNGKKAVTMINSDNNLDKQIEKQETDNNKIDVKKLDDEKDIELKLNNHINKEYEKIDKK